MSRRAAPTAPFLAFLALLAALVVPASTPVEAAGGVPATLAARLQELVDEERVALRAPGISAAVILPDGSRWNGQSGLADVARSVPVTATTTFAVGSITKTFVSAVIHQLVEERRLALEDPISTWFPSWPNGRDITVRMLLDHTSGIHNYFEHPSYESLVFGRPSHHWTTAEILGLVKGPYFAPGTGYHYSNTNYVLLGQIIRRVTGRSPAHEIRQRFLGPLGLDEERYQGQEPLPERPAARSYLRSGSGWDDQSDGSRMRPNTSAATVASDAGAMVGSARDMAAWARALYGGAVLRPETLAEIQTPSRYETYGLGVRRWTLGMEQRVAWGHTGSLRGTVNMVMHLPFENVSVAVLMDLGRVDPEPLTRRLALATFWALQIEAASEAPPPVDSTALRAEYDVQATLDTVAGTLAARTTVHVTNATSAPVGELALQLAPLGMGLATIGEVTVSGVAVPVVVRQHSILVPLDPQAEPGAVVDVTIDHVARFATGADGDDRRFSSAGGVFTAQHWIPWLAVERPFARPNQGEPFVTAVARSIVVDLTSDVPLTVATGAVQLEQDGGHLVLRATRLRDVAFAASTGYRMAARTFDGVVVRAYGATDADAELLLDEAARALRRLVARLGAYPHPQLSIARVLGTDDVVEAPAHAWIPVSDATSYAVTRAVAHQWFHSSVGSDEALDPFADEAPAAHLARLLTRSLRPSTCPAGRLDLTVYQVSDRCFEERIGVDGANMLEALRRQVGDATYWTAMRHYLAAHRNRFGGTRQLLEAIDDASPLDLLESYHLRFPRWF